MRYIKYTFIFLSILILVITGCDNSPAGPDYEKKVTVFGFLWEGEPLNAQHAVLVAYTRPLDQYYDLSRAGISGAAVTLQEVSSNRRFTLKDTPQKPGFYFNDSLIIRPQETYRLSAEIDGRTVSAVTTTPPLLHLTTDLSSDSVNYVYQKNLSRNMPVFMQSSNPDQIILVDMYCNEDYRNAEYISPFFGQEKPDNQQEYDGGRDGEPRHIQGMGRMREMISGSYPGQYVVDWYSSMIVFYGSNTMQVMAIDDNYHGFLHTEHPELNGGVTGGIGVFGSISGESYDLMVLKP